LSIERLMQPLAFRRGPAMGNRFMLAPLTNLQSHPDGRLSEDEFRWLTLRAKGGFGLVMTCATHVHAQGQGFPGQLGIFGPEHEAGLTRLAGAIRDEGALSAVQLHHAGARSPAELVGTPLAPSDDRESGARAMTEAEIETAREAFIAAALRAERAGFHGVEVHGAHSYLIAQFLSPELNRRTDGYGGAPEKRARLLLEILEGIRTRSGPDFQLGLRLSPERYGQVLGEIRELAQELFRTGWLDYLDMSLWDVGKEPHDEAYKGRSLLSYFAELSRGETRLGVAGKVMTAERAAQALEEGADFLLLGRAAILHHDFPRRVRADPAFRTAPLPVSIAHLAAEGLSPTFIDYMRNWKGFVEEAA